jgi:dolichol-phosphate mannosyltransferase
MKTVIVIPTYNEKENISPLIAALSEQFVRMRHDMPILVFDDSSPDGTAEVVRELQHRHPNLHLMIGQKAGLGAAYIRGMTHALQQLGADSVFEMDADFSHKPEDVPRLMVNIDHGADFVIGSRYVPGGTIPKQWGAVRRANSLFGNIVARYVAGIYRVRDCTAGFRAIRRALLRRIDVSRLRVQRYAFQVALLHARPRPRERTQIQRCGARRAIHQLRTFILLSQAFPSVAPPVHQLIGTIPATLVNYFLNSYWTFRHADDAS